jgi:prophage antirepressor-like protein
MNTNQLTKSETYPMPKVLRFDWHKHGIRVAMVGSKSAYQAVDCFEAIGIAWCGNKASLRGVPDRWKMTLTVADSQGRPSEAWFLTIEGVFALALNSRKPEAQEFTEWLIGVVAVAIANHGFYIGELETAWDQMSWQLRNAAEQRWHLRRLDILRRQPQQGIEYLSLAQFARSLDTTMTAVQTIGFLRALSAESKKLGLLPIAQPRGRGVKPGLLWPFPVLESCKTLFPPPMQPQLLLG